MEYSIVNKVRELCDENSISVSQVERDLGFSAGLISRWDKNLPATDKLISIAEYFNVSVDYILGRDESVYDNSIEKQFINKLIEDTKSHKLKWSTNIYNNINPDKLNDAWASLYYSESIKNVDSSDIDSGYCLQYANCCIYLVGKEIGEPFLRYYLFMQIDINQEKVDNNFISISDEQKINCILENCIHTYLITYKIKDKAFYIMNSFVNEEFHYSVNLNKNILVKVDSKDGFTLLAINNDEVYYLEHMGNYYYFDKDNYSLILDKTIIKSSTVTPLDFMNNNVLFKLSSNFVSLNIDQEGRVTILDIL